MVSRAVGFYHRNNGAENADGGKVHHGADDFQANLVAGFNHFQQRLAFFTDCNKGKADDNRKSQHLQYCRWQKQPPDWRESGF